MSETSMQVPSTPRTRDDWRDRPVASLALCALCVALLALIVLAKKPATVAFASGADQQEDPLFP